MVLSAGTIILIILLVLLLLLLILLWLLWARLNHRPPFRPAYPPEEFFLLDEVIIAGAAAAVTTAVEEMDRRGFRLDSIDSMDFGPFGSQILGCAEVPADYVIGLYRLSGRRKTVEDLNEVMSQLATITNVTIVSELNRITGSPWDPEPSPWDPEPSPWHIGTTSAIMDSKALVKADDFANQWAFSLINLATYARMSGGPRGRGVKVAVFDTAPFDVPDDGSEFTTTVDLPAPYQPYALKVRGQRELSNLPPEIRKNPVPDHGLFVSGLVQAVAPESTISLVRVLGENRRGTLYRLMRAIYDFLIAEILPDTDITQPQHRARAILNCSLGVRVPQPDESTLAEIAGALYPLAALRNLLSVSGCLGVMVAAAAGNDSYQSVDILGMNFPARLSITHDELNRDNTGTVTENPMLHILGVSACTNELKRACFSNEGSIAAPGGKGVKRAYALPDWVGWVQRMLPWLVARLAPEQMTRAASSTPSNMKAAQPAAGVQAAGRLSGLERYFTQDCMPYDEKYEGPDCPYGIIGPILDPEKSKRDPHTQPLFRYWPGTSFATPLVTGLAALHISKQPGGALPADIRQAIEASVRVPPGKPGTSARPMADDGLGEGIIYIDTENLLAQEKDGYQVKDKKEEESDPAVKKAD